MSGVKQATWSIQYDSVPQQPTDPGSFAARQEERQQRNREFVRRHLPELQSALADLRDLKIGLLGDASDFKRKQVQLWQRANGAMQREDLAGLRDAIRELNQLREEYSRKVKAAEFKKAIGNVQDALAACGYAVSSRREGDGTIVLQAAAFPVKSMTVKMAPAGNKMKLHVEDEHGVHCVEDIRSLQAELARHGMQLLVTDWGKGSPQSVHTSIQRNAFLAGE